MSDSHDPFFVEDAHVVATSAETAPAQAVELACPHCGVALWVRPEAQEFDVRCPRCGNSLSVAARHELEYQHATAQADAASRQAELDALRIRQVSAARRALIRVHTYWMIGLVACLVAVVQCAVLGVNEYLLDWTASDLHRISKAASFGVGSILAIYLATVCRRRARVALAESRVSALVEPSEAPDFSTLRDGSQHATDLEQIE